VARGFWPSCVTVTARPAIVTEPVRVTVSRLDAIVRARLPEPAPLVADGVIHDPDVAVHVQLPEDAETLTV
jgi:hypothetical protein